MPKKRCKVLMMMKAAKLGWAGAGAEREQGWIRCMVGEESGRAGAGQNKKTSIFSGSQKNKLII